MTYMEVGKPSKWQNALISRGPPGLIRDEVTPNTAKTVAVDPGYPTHSMQFKSVAEPAL